jgi:hypothetical protein
MLMEWTAAYVGLPYRRLGRDRSGVDCWGLARLPLVEFKGLALPLWDTVDPEDVPARCEAFETTRHDGSWLTVTESEARPFDFVRMRTVLEIDGRKVWRPVHIGLLAPRRHVLHIRRGETSCLEPIDFLRNRIVEFCRHRGLN